jgi:hypothetical protein
MSPVDAAVKWVVDRFEGEFAVCQQTETKEMRDVLRTELPEAVREGSVLRMEKARWVLDEEDARARSERIQKKMDGLWE